MVGGVAVDADLIEDLFDLSGQSALVVQAPDQFVLGFCRVRQKPNPGGQRLRQDF